MSWETWFHDLWGYFLHLLTHCSCMCWVSCSSFLSPLCLMWSLFRGRQRDCLPAVKMCWSFKPVCTSPTRAHLFCTESCEHVPQRFSTAQNEVCLLLYCVFWRLKFLRISFCFSALKILLKAQCDRNIWIISVTVSTLWSNNKCSVCSHFKELKLGSYFTKDEWELTLMKIFIWAQSIFCIH